MVKLLHPAVFSKLLTKGNTVIFLRTLTLALTKALRPGNVNGKSTVQVIKSVLIFIECFIIVFANTNSHTFWSDFIICILYSLFSFHNHYS